jgi:bifunctional non-homologous end joining protein LigD
MLRCPNGIQGEAFMQKEIPSYFPSWVERCELSKKEGTLRQVLVNNAVTLVYLANQGCVTLHFGLSRISKIDNPDYLIFDLDPSTEDIILLKKVAKKIKELADFLDMKSFIQTTGSRGFHIYIPLNRSSSFVKTHAFAKEFASYLAQKYPEEITIEQSKNKRGKRIFIDYARNSYGLNAVAPYSIRTKDKAPIATPLFWEELENKVLTPQTFTIANILKRLKKVKDPWKDMNKHQSRLTLATQKLKKITNRYLASL